MNTNSNVKVYPFQTVDNEQFISMQNIRNSNSNINSKIRENSSVNAQNLAVSYQGSKISNLRTLTQ